MTWSYGADALVRTAHQPDGCASAGREAASREPSRTAAMRAPVNSWAARRRGTRRERERRTHCVDGIDRPAAADRASGLMLQLPARGGSVRVSMPLDQSVAITMPVPGTSRRCRVTRRCETHPETEQ